MKILFTGGSSFTGYWFIKELSNAGHDVYATFTGSSGEAYAGVRADRVSLLMEYCQPIWNCKFGDEKFLQTILDERQMDVLCHHAANVKNYQNLDFDLERAISENTNNINQVLKALVETGCQKIILTGSVFEQDEGIGAPPLSAFSPYGLSKGLTAEIFKYWCNIHQLPLRKFVIPNPFGPYEEPRFTTYLAKTWLQGNIARVNTPLYVRDNVHVSLLTKTYRYFVELGGTESLFSKTNPSGYIESQGAFSMRFAEAMKARLNIDCRVDLASQKVFKEPRVRVNYDSINIQDFEWSAESAWDVLAEYYKQRFV